MQSHETQSDVFDNDNCCWVVNVSCCPSHRSIPMFVSLSSIYVFSQKSQLLVSVFLHQNDPISSPQHTITALVDLCMPVRLRMAR
jgi:hypothetical protein